MKQAIIAAGLIVVALAALAASAAPWQGALAQDTRGLTVEVTFKAPSEDKPKTGDRCGFLLSPFSSTDWPLGKQVLIRDATDTIVGTVDLADVFDLTQSKETRPGTFSDKGLCVVTAEVDVPDSPFYTFTVEGVYQWTIKRDDLERRDWTMEVLFLP